MLLSCGCYHQYGYVTDDPGFKIGGTGQVMDILVPVGGQTLLLSTKRYNAIAEVVPHLPVIEPPVRIGDVQSYPNQPMRLDGSPVPQDDLLFPETPVFCVVTQIDDSAKVSIHDNTWAISGRTVTVTEGATAWEDAKDRVVLEVWF